MGAAAHEVELPAVRRVEWDYDGACPAVPWRALLPAFAFRRARASAAMMACGSKCFGMGRGALFTPFGARARASFSRPAMNARSADDLDTACLRGAAAAAAGRESGVSGLAK